jgi:hypothetical protein
VFFAPLQVAPAPAVSSIQQIREARLQPLKIALQDAIALHTKATGVREALEVEVSGNSNVFLSYPAMRMAHMALAASLQGGMQIQSCAAVENGMQHPGIWTAAAAHPLVHVA